MAIRIIQPAPAPMSTAEDVGRSTMSGLEQGMAGVAGLPGDVSTFFKALPVRGAQFLEQHGVLKPGSAAGLQQQINTPTLSPMEILAAAASGANQRVAENFGMAPEDAQRVSRLTSMPTTRDIEQATGVDKTYHTPQTRAGKYARTIAQMAPGATTGGGALRRLAQVIVPGAASEGAGELAQGTPFEPYARVAGALAGGLGVGLAATPHPTTRILAEASRPATDGDIAQALALRQEAARRGVTLTQAEAMQQVTGNGTGMGRLQRVLEGTRNGSEVITPIMSARPGQVGAAMGRYADTLGPASADPYSFGQQAQGAAEGVLTDVRQQINRNARPFYDALPEETMPPTPAAERALADPAYQEALAAVRGNPVLNRDVANLPDNNLAVVNEATKQLGTLAENSRPNPAASTGNAQMSAAYDAARGNVDDLASAYSEPWQLARGMVRSQNEQFLDPLKAGPLGAISQTPNIGAQTRALFPTNPAEGAAGPTNMAMQMLPPEVAQGLARQHVMNGFNEATQNLQSGPNQWGGAKFAARVAGNPEQRRVLGAGVEGAGGDRGDLAALLQVLEATGKRQAAGSQTAYNLEELRNLGEAGTVGTTVKAVASGPATFRKIGDALQDWQMGRNSRGLAEAITANPERAQEILLEARRRVPEGALRDEVDRLLLTTAQGRLAAPAQ
jgi:hypothetical protein